MKWVLKTKIVLVFSLYPLNPFKNKLFPLYLELGCGLRFGQDFDSKTNFNLYPKHWQNAIFIPIVIYFDHYLVKRFLFDFLCCKSDQWLMPSTGFRPLRWWPIISSIVIWISEGYFQINNRQIITYPIRCEILQFSQHWKKLHC